MKLLDKNEEDIIHEESLRCLREVGMAVGSPIIRKMLKDAGADVDDRTKVVKFPESLVMECVKKAPKQFTLHGRDKKHDMHLPVDGIPYVGTTGLSIHMTDLDTGKTRTATVKDVADFAIMGDALDEVNFLWSVVIPRDVPEEAHTSYEVWHSLTNSGKHHQQIECRNAVDAEMQIKIGSLLCGGPEELRKRPIFSVLVSPDSPLVMREAAMEAQTTLAKAGIPILCMTMPLSGITGPVTMAGTLTLINSENLASLCVTQLANPGNPHIYGSDGVPGDMATGGVAYEAPEVPAIFAGLGQMAKRYGIPSVVGDWGLCGDSTPGIGRSFSEMSCTALDTFSGTDLTSGIGSTDTAKGASLEQMVIDNYVWKNWKGFLRRFDITEEKAALDITKAVGYGNTFLTNPHTVRNFKKELFFRSTAHRNWEATLSKSMVPEAREIAKKILKEHQQEMPVDKSVLKEGEKLINEYAKRFACQGGQ
jgi:trimethylamine--corrinoid protein Co-methyltransferase